MLNSLSSDSDMNKEKNIQLMVSQISGNSSRKDDLQIENWIKESGENAALYAGLKRAWKYSEVKDSEHKFNVDKAWDKFKQRTDFETASTKSTVNINRKAYRRIAFYVSGIAASLIILFGLFFVFNNDESNQDFVNYYAASVQADNAYVLPDGTEMYLNKDSKVRYPEEFGDDFRKVNFGGEAFFNVAHNPDKPMIIATGGVRIKVLGTSFDLCNCPNSDEISLYLETGKVLFYSVNPKTEEVLESVIVLPGQKAVYNKKEGTIFKSDIDNYNHMVWKTGVLDFVATPMPEVLKVISNAYRVDFMTDVPIDSMIVTARYENENPESIMEALSIIFDIDYNIENDSIRIY